jgi:predicted nucleic-acid-binding protein
VKALDTNLAVRLLLTEDAPSITASAQTIVAEERAFIAKSVLLEVHWLLRKAGKMSRGEVSVLLRGLLSTVSIDFEDRETCRAAVDAASAGIEFDDALHVLSTPSDCEFATFDEQLAKRWPRLNSPIRVLLPESPIP